MGSIMTAAMVDGSWNVTSRVLLTSCPAVDALENATPFYEKLGFKKVDELIFDRTAAGHEGTLRIDIMIREPRATAVQSRRDMEQARPNPGQSS